MEKDRDLIREHREKADANIPEGIAKGFAKFYCDSGMLVTPGYPVAQGNDAYNSSYHRISI